MPLHDYLCKTCKHTSEEYFKRATDDNAVIACPKCGGSTHARQISLAHTDLKSFHTPIEMYSVACNSMEEIRQMQAAGVPVNDDPKHPMFGVPIASNRKEKLAALKAAKFQETN